MSDYKIQFVNELPEDIDKLMRDDLIEYETKHGIDVNFKRFALILTNNSGKVFGVLNDLLHFLKYILMICGYINHNVVMVMEEN